MRWSKRVKRYKVTCYCTISHAFAMNDVTENLRIHKTIGLH